MEKPGSRAIANRVGALRLRVHDADRAAAFFGALLGARARRERVGSHTEQRLVGRSALVSEPIDAIFSDDPRAPAQRLLFETPDPEAALQRVVALGGAGNHAGDARDAQGLPLGFYAAEPAASDQDGARSAPGHAASDIAAGALGVLILQVPDTAIARAFYQGLCGQDFHKVGESGDFWWANQAAMGVFPMTHDITHPERPLEASAAHVRPFFCVAELEQAMTRVRELGGETFGRTALGPYAVCGCRDDQAFSFGLWCDTSR